MQRVKLWDGSCRLCPKSCFASSELAFIPFLGLISNLLVQIKERMKKEKIILHQAAPHGYPLIFED